MGYVLKAVLSSAQHPEYGQITVPFPIPDEKYDRMIELLEPLEIGDALRQDCRVDELDSFYTVLNRLVGSLVNFDELDYLAKRLDSFDDGEAAQFQGMACKLGVSNIKDFINLTFCCQQATVITDFSDLDAIGRQHYMTMQGGGCRIEELERLDGRKFALDLILNHLEGRITPYGVVYDTEVRIWKASSCRRTPATILQRKKAGTLLARSRRSACPAIKSALMTLLSYSALERLLSRVSLISCWSLCMTGWDAISTKPHSSQSGLPRRASMFGASMRERS